MLKKAMTPMRDFISLKAAKATLKGIEAIRMIVKGGVYDLKLGVCGETEFIDNLFGVVTT